jgi:hypothetical protein
MVTRIRGAERRGAGMRNIAPDDRPDASASSPARRRLDDDRVEIGRWDVQYWEEFIPTAVAIVTR